MPDFLRKIPFTAELLPVVDQFDCGSDPWETPLAAWIQAGRDVKNGAIYEMRRAERKGKKLEVWLHVNEANELVGYSSLGESNWPWPEAHDPRVPINIVPCLALGKRFQGKPLDPPRYSKQIMDHLIFETRKHQDRYPLLGLYVDPRNFAAMRFYTRENFVNLQTFVDPVDGIEYQGMILKL